MSARLLIAAVLAAAVVAPSRPDAWGLDVHRFITDRAIDLLPETIRPFYQKHRAFIVERSIDPDLWRVAGFEDEPPRHFVDMDAYGKPPFPDLPRDYDRAVERYGVEFVRRNGTLPWRAAEVHGQLTRAFAEQARGGRGYTLDNIRFHSAVLAHYVEDGHVPLHAVLNYDGQLTGQHGIHSRWESELVMRTVKDLALSPPPVTAIADVRTFMWKVLEESFPHAETILASDKRAIAGREFYDDGYFGTLDADTRPIVEARLSAAISAVAGVIVGAWESGGKPVLPLEPKREPRRVTKTP
jgi:hypothetical protein